MRKWLFVGSFLYILSIACLSHAGEWFNGPLPKWIKLDVELRHRYEYMSDFDFNKAVDDNKGFHLYRTRINLAVQPAEEIKLFSQFQDARITNDSISGSKAAYENWADLRQLWLQVKSDQLAIDSLGLSGIGFIFGRQELFYGAQRLVGGFNWSNVAQTFDAGKLIFEFEKYNLSIDIFGGGKTPVKSPREFDDLFDGDSNDRLGGYYAVFTGIEGLTVDQYVLNRNTDGKTVSFGHTGDGEVEDYTIGIRLKGNIPDSKIDYEIETANQVGNSGALDVNAQMFIGIIGYSFDRSWKPRAAFEFDYASGDSDKSDGDRKTFDNLYPTNHLFYGYMDLVSLQNINNYRFQLSVNPTDKLKLQSDFHLIYLDSSKDNLYAANRTIKRATAAGAGSHVGNEVDLTGTYKFNQYADVLVGYSHLFAGDFLKDTGSADDADYVYVQTTLSF